MLAQLAGLGWYMRDEYPRQRLHFWYSVKPVRRTMHHPEGYRLSCYVQEFLEMPERPRWPRVPR